MPGSKILAPLIAIAAIMVVASASLAAVLISGDGDDGGSSTSAAVIATPTVQPTAIPATPTLPSGNAIPEALRARFDALPEKLRNEILDQLNRGLLRVQQLEQVIRGYELRNAGVRVGSVVEVDNDSLRLEVYTTGEDVEVAINADTVITRGPTRITAADLRKDEMVMVISRDNGATAFGVEALGVQAP
jgi:hypothetical protein